MQCLLEQNLLEVIHTTDGREYLTPNELGKEIREELLVRGGKVNDTAVKSAELSKNYSVYLLHSMVIITSISRTL